MIFMCDSEVKEEDMKLTFNSLLNFCQHYTGSPGKEVCPMHCLEGYLQNGQLEHAFGMESGSHFHMSLSIFWVLSPNNQVHSSSLMGYCCTLYRCLIKCYFMIYKKLIFTGSRLLLCKWKKRISVTRILMR